jgi:hypothetical protein
MYYNYLLNRTIFYLVNNTGPIQELNNVNTMSSSINMSLKIVLKDY